MKIFTETALRYIRYILEQRVILFAENMGVDFTVKLDNVRPHVTMRHFLIDCNTETMEWSANSLNFNPIENIWDMLRRRR